MNLTIRVEKLASHDYVAEVECNLITARSVAHYPNIESAIRREAEGAVDFASFVECKYEGMSTGTYKAAEMARDAGSQARRLVGLYRASRFLALIRQG